MKFRLTDEREWESAPFEASNASELALGVRKAWDTYAAKTFGSVHPAMAARVKLAEIDRWLAEREARPDATDDQIRSWRANAQHRRYQITVASGAELSPLAIHVWDDVAGSGWLNPGTHKSAIAPRVKRVLSEAEAFELVHLSAHLLEHMRRLMGMAASVGEKVRERLYPAPRLVQ